MKLDLTKIEGYNEMSAEDKLKALESYDIPEPDYSGYVKKEDYDKTASELSKKKKELEAKLSEDELAEKKAREEREDLEKKYEELLHKSLITEHKTQLLSLGYEEKLAQNTAEAIVKGDMNTVFKNQKQHLEAYERKIRKEILNDTPKPKGGGNSDTITLESLRKMSPQDRYTFSKEHPEEYKALYGGNE